MKTKSIFKDCKNKNLTHPRSKRGVTLLALIITIVVLLILSGITINGFIGNESFIEKMAMMTEKYNQEVEKEGSSIGEAKEEVLGVQNNTWKETANNAGIIYAELTDTQFASLFSGGNGTENSPYLIERGLQLAHLSNCVASGVTHADGKYYKLTKDIDLKGKEWTPIGISSDRFIGNFNGGGHKISNISVNQPSSNTGVGLFGAVDATSILENITIDSGEITGRNYAGGIVGLFYGGTIKNCINYAKVNATFEYAAGIVAKTSGDSSIEGCINYGTIATTTTGKFTAGIVAAGEGTSQNIVNCINNGHIIAAHQQNGGIAGCLVNATLEGCVNNGTVVAKLAPRNENNATSSSFIAGLVGYIENSTITNCYNTGDVTAENTAIGGIAGRNDNATISYCYNTGKIYSSLTVQPSYVFCVGGIAGDNQGTIEYCYNEGIIEVPIKEDKYSALGGITGLNRNNGSVRYCYSQGEILNSNRNGGLVGQLYNGTLTKNFFYHNNVEFAIAYIGTDWKEEGTGSNVTGQAEKLTSNEASSITNFEEFKEWIKNK